MRPADTAQAAERAMQTIERCINILHDLAAQSPQAAAATVAALQLLDTPAAESTAYLVRHVAEARHGLRAMRRAEYKS
ncbi:hypothetical protein K2Z83_26330 [Oscillochloris sp. ZM17-4]|uniref:hypothetical protein n=1 Tax=Oscillochloris sp. ZM17-4 TaxID=2866714 RepID=UPI001C73D7C1|nr:hypothetical protein [Oscillochloris sp. ZM17-4]MBX0331171.1 hypothetical protein [Oscillochloris sp. ZM17-4]